MCCTRKHNDKIVIVIEISFVWVMCPNITYREIQPRGVYPRYMASIEQIKCIIHFYGTHNSSLFFFFFGTDTAEIRIFILFALCFADYGKLRNCVLHLDT